MRNTIILILVAIAVLSPFVFPEILHAPGITELSLFEACVYTSIVAVIIILGFIIIKHFVPNKTYLLLCESPDENNYSLLSLFQKKGLKIIPKTIDYFSTQYKDNKEDEFWKLLNHSSGTIVIIGEQSSKSQFFHQMIKILKKENINTLYLKDSDNIDIPVIVQKNKIIGTIDQLKDPVFIENFINLLKQ